LRFGFSPVLALRRVGDGGQSTASDMKRLLKSQVMKTSNEARTIAEGLATARAVARIHRGEEPANIGAL
jgi:hypothetical protein